MRLLHAARLGVCTHGPYAVMAYMPLLHAAPLGRTHDTCMARAWGSVTSEPIVIDGTGGVVPRTSVSKADAIVLDD